MATSTKATGRGRTAPARGAAARKPAARTATQKTVKCEAKPGLPVRVWMALAHLTGGAARALDAWTFGGLFGRVAFALPVIMLLFAIWLFRKPSSVHDNGRVGIGMSVLLVSVSGLCHIFGGMPAPSEGMERLALSGGVIGWMIAAPLIFLTTSIGATIVVILLLVLSLFIITRTPPNKLPERLRELYAWLFGAQLPDAEERQAGKDARLEKTAQIELDGVDGDNSALPWWRRNNSKREEDPDFDSPVTSGPRGKGKGKDKDKDSDTDTVDPLRDLLSGGAGGFDTALEPADSPANPRRDHYGTEVL